MSGDVHTAGETLVATLIEAGFDAFHWGEGQVEIEAPVDVLLTVCDDGTVEANRPMRDEGDDVIDLVFMLRGSTAQIVAALLSP